jgi:4-amino-4-deoxy-L-arabinose transferase-like glycosyltransferase
VTTTETTLAQPGSSPLKPRSAALLAWHRIGLAGILLVAAFLNFFRLGQIGLGVGRDSYYAAGVKSMLMSWHNFFFVSFDPSGFVTIDKPPLGFWIQVADAKLFGFSGLSLRLPEALAGVLCVALLYYLVACVFGRVAGLLAALALALSPTSIIASHKNTLDMLLVLTMLLAAWAVGYATQTGRLRWLLICTLFVGLGFNIKMLEAYLVVPAFGLVYLLGAPLRWWTRIAHLALALVVLLVISFSWVAAVDLTPASQRPYVGSSGTNSELNLALGFNGWERLTGPTGFPRTDTDARTGASTSQQSSPIQQHQGSGGTGTPGPLRLLSQQLGGLVGWLLPTAVLSLLVASWRTRNRLPLDRRQQALVLWGMWLLTMGVFFSVAGQFQWYYLVMLVPSICALFGIGVMVMWQNYRHTDWPGWVLPLALVGTAAIQIRLLADFPDLSHWLTPIIVGLCLLVATVLVVVRLFTRPALKRGKDILHEASGTIDAQSWFNKRAFLIPIVATGVLALLIAPMVRGGITLLQNTNSPHFPLLSPGQQENPSAGFSSGFEQQTLSATLPHYLQTHQGKARFLVATLDAGAAAPLILATDKPVMALGGYSGTDRILTPERLVNLIENGTVRFFLLPLRQDSPNNDLMQWVNTHCTAVPASQWQSAPSRSGAAPGASSNGSSSQQLFDCATHH